MLDPNKLYPSVAVSEVPMILGYLYGAYLFAGKNDMAALGFISVALAAFFGIFRFGVATKPWQPLHAAFADLAGIVGLPCVGFQIISTRFYSANMSSLQTSPATYMAANIAIYLTANAVLEPKRVKGVRTLASLAGFIGPVLYEAFVTKNQLLGASAILFAGLGIVVGQRGPIFGILRENLFHYVAPLAGVGIALGLTM